MAAADAPAGLMDIASTLSQDDIPFKLRCAICNNLAVNAFRLPCCDQSICETCQTSLSDVCPVCAHTPVSPDLCKPNKALRTTLKAFLRTEEKKREKDRQSAAPPTQVVPAPTTSEPAATATASENDVDETVQAGASEVPPPAETKTDKATTEPQSTESVVNGTAEPGAVESVESEVKAGPEADHAADQAPEAAEGEANAKVTNGDEPAYEQSAAPQDMVQPGPNMMNAGFGGFPGMNWNANGNFNGVNPFMANAMFNFPNPMGMPMTMDPMAANQGMFGDYGMNMTGMGMNMGMNFNGQGMYGSLGWDGSQQNMWQGGQDKFNPNAFANGTGPPYGGAFGGSNMSYPSNSGFQSGYYGPGYGRGGFRGRGRGGFQGPGRGGFAGHNTNNTFFNQHFSEEGSGGNAVNGESISEAGEHGAAAQTQEAIPANDTAGTAPESGGQDSQQFHGIPTVDSLNQSMSMGPNGYQGPMGLGYGRGGFMRGSGGRGSFRGGPYMPQIEQPPGPGVEGAPAAPRAMRQGLPNTSVFRQRGFHVHGRSSVSSNTPAMSQRGNSEVTQDAEHARSPSRAPSQPLPAVSQGQSPSRSPHSRQVSPPVQVGDERHARDEGEERRTEDDHVKDRRSRSPSQMSSAQSSRRHRRDGDRDRQDGRRSHRSRRHRSRSYSRSRSRSPTRNGLGLITEESKSNGHKTASEAGDPLDLATRISSHRSSKDRPSRRDEERDRDRARDSRRRDRDRDRDRGRERRDRDRDSERDRRRDRERDRGYGRDRDRGREREQDRDKDRDRVRGERDRKRSRRDRSESVTAGDDSSRPKARRVKHAADEGQDGEHDRPKAPTIQPEPEKDPYTLEREARNRERMLREEQNRSGAKHLQSKSDYRRGSRQERLVGGRRINYKYEDEL